MLRIGLTGGIGAGKSTVSRAFADHGALVVDGDVLSREVVQPGTEGLAALVDEFGHEILLPDGALNRPALAAIAFTDDDRRAKLNGIVHPLVAHRRAELIASAAQDALVVEDIPLLVESQMAPLFPLVVVVNADPEVRLRRLVEQRGFGEADARARIAAQATEQQRREVADVWLDNTGTEGELVERARDLWHQRIVPFAHNVATGAPAPDPHGLVPADPDWPAQAARILSRLRTACGHRASRVDHIGSTAVTGLDARDIIDVQITVDSLDVAAELADDLLAAGYPGVPTITADESFSAGDILAPKRFHASADPVRPTHLHIRAQDNPHQRSALLFVDWLNANPGVRADYAAAKWAAAKWSAAKRTGDSGAVRRWLTDAHRDAELWAETTGWRIS